VKTDKIERRARPRGMRKQVDRSPSVQTKRSRLVAPVLRRLKASRRADDWTLTRELRPIAERVLRTKLRACDTCLNDVLRDLHARGLATRVFGYVRLTARGRRVA
jgi:hypothetical protein